MDGFTSIIDFAVVALSRQAVLLLRSSACREALACVFAGTGAFYLPALVHSITPYASFGLNLHKVLHNLVRMGLYPNTLGEFKPFQA